MNQKITYNLSGIPGFLNCIKTNKIPDEYEKYYNIQEYSTKANEKYSIIKYNKEFLRADLISSFGLLRSVIHSNNFIVSFSPPKSLSGENFITKYPLKTDLIVAEEFVEGTMINVFFDPKYGANGCWQIATRNTVGGYVSFFNWSKKTFNQMFLEACISCGFNIQTLNPRFCYSFVLQHPENRIVTPFGVPKLYLVSVYEIIQKDEEIIIEEQNMMDVKNFGLWNLTGIKFPEIYDFSSYSDLIEKYASANTSYNVMGVIVKNLQTGERSKFRNPIYEEVKHLRGNQPKLQYQYLTLRHSGKLPEFLKYYPEVKADMSKFREQVHLYTNNLHANYISCFVKKTKSLKEFPENYRTNMFKLHEHYIHELRPNKLFITNTEVIKFVNKLPPTLLMYCLNYNMRKRLIDSISAGTKLN